MPRITINFYAESISIEPTFRNSIDFLRVEAAGISAKDILQALQEADGIDLDEVAEVLGKNAMLEWADENKPEDSNIEAVAMEKETKLMTFS